MFRRILFVTALVLFVGFGAPATEGSYGGSTTIGWATPSGWAGGGAKIYYWGDAPQWDGSNWVYVPRAQQVSSGANTPVDTGNYAELIPLPPFPPPHASGQAWGLGYELHARMMATGGYSSQWEAGAFVRDELYFQTVNAKPGVLELVFNVTGTTAGDGYVNVLWQADPAHGGPYLSTPAAITGSPFDQELVLRTSDLGYQVASGTYLPYTLAAWGWAQNGSVDFSNTITLAAVHAYQSDAGGNLVPLSSADFTVFSQSGDNTFNQFAHTMPEPGTLMSVFVVLGWVLVGSRRA